MRTSDQQCSENEKKLFLKTNGFVMLLPVWMQNNRLPSLHNSDQISVSVPLLYMPTITTNTRTPGLTRPQSKQTQSELTIDLILRLRAPSAAPSEEVWGVGLLHEDLLQRTCSGSRRRFSSQHKGVKREDVEEVQLMQLLTLWIFSAACAAGHSCRVGLWRHWVRGQNMKCSKLKHMLTSPWNTKKTNSYHHSVAFTHSPAWDSQESARSTARRARRVAYVQDIFSSESELLKDTSSEADQEGEVSKMWEVGWEPGGVLTACQRRGREWPGRSDKRLNPANSREGFQVTGRCWGLNFVLTRVMGLWGPVCLVKEGKS